LNPDKTLAEQGIIEHDIVILKKKFFFTDQNIDKNDPVQLNLLYSQALEGVLSGKNPCTMIEATQFAAIQCQELNGDHLPSKHKPGFLNIKDFIPPEYAKKKDIEKKIYHEHQKLVGLSNLNTKLRYVQLCRSLKSYGITFFLVKEAAKRKKLVNALIGVTKSSVVKLDMETKEVITEWKLTQLRRWAASPNSFTLDFGDYAEAYYSVQTTEGEQIAGLISGYIDIILKKRKEIEKIVVEDEIEETTVEEYIKPTKATNFVSIVNPGQKIASESRLLSVGANPGGMRAGTMANYPAQMVPQSPVIQEKEPEYINQQRVFSAGVKSAIALLKYTSVDLSQISSMSPVGNDPAAQAWREQTIDVNSLNIAAQIAGQLAIASSIMINATGVPEDMNYELLQSNVTSMVASLSQMGPALKLVASLGDGDELMEYAMALVRATQDLINTCENVAMGEVGIQGELHANGQNLAREANKILANLQALEISNDEQNELSSLASSVGRTVMDLVVCAKTVSKTTQDAETVSIIISDAKFAYETGNNLIASVNASLPCMNVQQCSDQVLEGSVMLREVLSFLAESCIISTDMLVVDQFLDSAQKVEDAIARLVDKGMFILYLTYVVSKAGIVPGSEDTELDKHYDSVVLDCEMLLANSGGMEAIIVNTKRLTLSSTRFISELKKTANECEEDDEKQRLNEAAKNLATSTSRMVAGAKEVARETNNSEKQQEFKSSVDGLKMMSNAAAGPQLRDRVMIKLSKAVKV
jgi:talin